MKKRIWLALLLGGMAAFLLPGHARADGIIIPEPPPCLPGPCPPEPFPVEQLEIRYHEVRVTIEDQLATTKVDQVFYNPNLWEIEGRYMFPIPPGAAISNFQLWMDGEAVNGRVLEAAEARRTYEDIVRTLRDPALLEYAGQGALEARIFPIPPGGERRIQLEYSEVLPAEDGLVRYLYPLNTEKFSVTPLESVLVAVTIKQSSMPVQTVYSPSHPVSIDQTAGGLWEVRYEASQVRPDTDFLLYTVLGEQTGLHVLTYRDEAETDGYFLLLATPPHEQDVIPTPKDVVLVLDRSGSMDGEKFHQAQEALRYILERLNPEDHFSLIAFSSQVELFPGDLNEIDRVAAALSWVDRLGAAGSTNIYQALQEALNVLGNRIDLARPGYVIFLTDGLPTEGVVEAEEIIRLADGISAETVRLFPFGVGYDVDTFLLDSLAREGHGTSQYVRPGEPLNEILTGFYNRIRSPILTNVELDFDWLGVYDLYPQPLPDLFAGSQLLVTGRYREGGRVDLILRGREHGETRTFIFPEQEFLAENAADDGTGLSVIARLWATRKIGYLLSQIRLNGPDPETIEQIVNLSVRYGIVTPYTSYLVTEETPLGDAAQANAAEEAYELLREAPAEAVSGEAAVEKAAREGDMQSADSAQPGGMAGVAGDNKAVKTAGSRTFVWQGGMWVDTRYDPDRMELQEIEFLSPEYFMLASESTQVAAGLAVGERVILVTGSGTYQVLPGDMENPPLESLPGQGESGTPIQPAPTEPESESNQEPPGTVDPGVSPDPSGSFPCLAPLPPGLLAVGLVIFSKRRVQGTI